MFPSIEALDNDGLSAFRKKVKLAQNFKTLKAARSLGIIVAFIIIEPN